MNSLSIYKRLKKRGTGLFKKKKKAKNGRFERTDESQKMQECGF